MKKISLLLFVSMLMATTSLFSQETKNNEITLGYGIATTDEVMDVTLAIFTTILGRELSNETSSGAIILTYRNLVKEHWLIGGVVVLEQFKADVSSQNKPIGTEKRNHFTVALEGNYQYLNKEIFQMYSGLGMGYTFGKAELTHTDGQPNETDNLGHVNFQLTAVGFRVGKAVSGFAELGFGYKGIANFGISFRF